MDFCRMGSISDLMERCDVALTEDQIAWVCANTLKGLEYLHGMNVIHRDVKAANILLNEKAVVKIGIIN